MATITRYKVQNENQSIEFSNQSEAEAYASSNGLAAPTSFTKEVVEIPVVTIATVIPSYDSDPMGVTGAVYFNTVLNKIKFFNGTSWETVASE